MFPGWGPLGVVGGVGMGLLGRPVGERGFLGKEGGKGGGEWKRVEGKATECERMSAEVLEEERRGQTAEWFAQEYLCSFVGLENEAFRAEWLAAAREAGRGFEALRFEFEGGDAGGRVRGRAGRSSLNGSTLWDFVGSIRSGLAVNL
ncbi:MAG: hypothetical protein ACK5ZJ_11245 [Acidobacteriota bacterium]